MKIIGFTQVYNEVQTGNLLPWIKNIQELVDEVVLYDDGSTDGSYEMLRENGVPEENIIHSDTNDFRNEIIHKQQLLELAVAKNPDWIFWMDIDTLFDNRYSTKGKWDLEEMLFHVPEEYGGVCIGHLNLWRSTSWHRTDDGYGPDTITPTAFWRNNGQLHFPYGGGLHNPQYPQGMGPVLDKWDIKLLHFGFSGHQGGNEAVIRKYLTYKANGQTGRALDRLIDERTMVLEPVDFDIFPPKNRPVVRDPKPEPFNFDVIRFFDSYRRYQDAVTDGDI